MAGIAFMSADDEREVLELPFVPTETNINRSATFVEIAPPGMSGTFQQFTQGGTRRMSMSLLLNDVGRRSQDVIRGGYYLNDDLYTEVNNTRTALEWFDLLSNTRSNENGVMTPPAPLDIFITDYFLGRFIITGFNPVIVLRHKQTIVPETDSFGYTNSTERYYIGGSAARATIRLDLRAHNEVPTIQHPNVQW